MLIIGISSGILSTFAVLRQQSLLGDAIAHAVLPGLCISFMITLTKHSVFLLIGGLTSGLIGTFIIYLMTRYTIIKSDTAMGIVLSVFFGAGLFLLTIVQRIPTARQSGLDTFLFGNASSMLVSDLWVMGTCLAGITCMTILFWKELKSAIFDSEFCTSIGIPVHKMNILLTIMLVVTIVIGLQCIGVVLMSALIIAPGVSARQWSNRLSGMVFCSVFICLLSGISGVWISASTPNVPTGPVIVIALSVCVIISLLFAPNRGLLIHALHQWINRHQLKKKTVLHQFYLLAMSHEDLTHAHNINALSLIGGRPPLSTLVKLQADGLVHQTSDSCWGLTHSGATIAMQLHEDYNANS